MSSLLTNNSAMVALQTLKTINKDLGSVQNQISTGKRIATARDNAALWGISTTMQTDVSGFKAISESLSLGSATLSVARDGAETIASLLDTLKGKIVAAQEDNVDRDKIQADVKALRDQIKTVVDAASFNGLNLLKGDNTSMTVNVLASLNRDSNQSVTSSNISFDRKSLETGVTGTASVATAARTAGAVTLLTAGTGGGTLANTIYSVGDVISANLTNAQGQGIVVTHTVTAADIDTEDMVTFFGVVATTFNTQLSNANTAGTFLTAGLNATPFSASTNNLQATFTTDANYIAVAQAAGSGGLSALSLLDVSTEGGAKAALGAIEDLIQTSIDAAASFGSAQGRIQTQTEYVGKIMDGLTSGIGALVDADMEQASARLQALQVQQQLGIQALSIANQSPQNILALFR